MAVIHVLDKHTAELIAAGEVVERPASVVKELLENSIDAGATQVTVSIESGGVKLIEVSDNGSGIEPAYISTAFIRHATSKIAVEADLNSIHTLGFRGEALASIASVARVELLTRTEDSEFASLYRNEGGEEGPCEPAARAVGTTIRVRDLFYNTPARMKFLKKDSSEGTFVSDVVTRLALSHPEVSFKFVREGKTQYVTPGDGDLRGAAYAVLGREFSRDLIEVNDESNLYRIHGLITPPKSCRASRSMQYFYINGRYVRNRTMMAGMETAFKGTTMQGKFPGGLLMLEMPADLVDVNVHPAKTEVRFARENDVFDVVYHAVKLALATPGSGERRFVFDSSKETFEASDSDNAKAIEKTNDNKTEKSVKQDSFTGLSAVIPGQSEPGVLKSAAKLAPEPDEPEIQSEPLQPKRHWWGIEEPIPKVMELRSPEPARPKQTFRPAEQESKLDISLEEPEEWTPDDPFAKADASAKTVFNPLPEPEPAQPEQQAMEAPETELEETSVQPEQTVLPGADAPIPLSYVGEAFQTYIIAQRGEELCLIDKHAAHERQIYEKLAASYGDVPSQLLLAPLVITLSAEEKQALMGNIPLLENVGIEVGDFGGNTVLLRAVPCDVEQDDLEDMLVEIADKLARGSRDALSERTEWVLHSVSCRAAIKAGDRTSPEELMALAEKILSGEVPPFCPHGRPCVLKLTRKELEKQFGRIE
ncbi:DNA mismatch repair endonuclease MutL [Faecalibacterium sp. An122]|uniref:DNA mismatch repair endonuclease MutL n=1 Tax=Faecalibacterium sp. An122 TaxID=1965551 RepID=UPI000B399F3F|nr:DNA mismatch repair endonuclease MutL [Faecalibacterium sp. An122]OUQ40014.1 DNA mismatch repair protein MutL [Faecalibacterium sp. An122]